MKKQSQYTKFLEQKHKNFNTPDTLIAAAVTEATGETIKKQTRIIRGENNEVYDIMTQNNREIIVRIGHHNNWQPFLIEKWIFEKCNQLHIPVPKMLLISDLPLQKISLCVQTKLPGVTLDQLDLSTHKMEIKLYIAKAAAYLAKLHTIQTTGFDGLDIHGHGVMDTYFEWITKRTKTKEQLFKIAQIIKLDKKHITEGLLLLEHYDHFFPKVEQSYLIYNDFMGKHMFVNDNEIVGFIDFEVALSGDPVYDFAKWEYYFSADYPLQWVIDGYTNKKLFNEFFQKKIHVYKLHYALGALKYDYEKEYPWGYQHAAKQIIENSDWLKKYER